MSSPPRVPIVRARVKMPGHGGSGRGDAGGRWRLLLPYFALQAPTDAWWTKTQLEVAQATIQREFVAPSSKETSRERAHATNSCRCPSKSAASRNIQR